jgi:hypothetical protein
VLINIDQGVAMNVEQLENALQITQRLVNIQGGQIAALQACLDGFVIAYLTREASEPTRQAIENLIDAVMMQRAAVLRAELEQHDDDDALMGFDGKAAKFKAVMGLSRL